MKKTLSKIFLVIGFCSIVILFLCLAGVFFLWLVTPSSKGVIEKGNLIVSALESYHKDKSKYPDDLSDLSPEYIESLPKHGFRGRGFYYKKIDDNQFELSFLFKKRSYEGYYYHNDTSEWIGDF